MIIYSTIKNIGKEIKYAAKVPKILGIGIIGGLAALVIGCAPSEKLAQMGPFPAEEVAQVQVAKKTKEAPETSRMSAYFGPRFGAIWAHGEPSDGTSYPKSSSTLGFEAEFGRRNGGFGVGITLDSFKSEASDTVNGTDYNVKNDSLVVGAGIIYTSKRTSPVKLYGGADICDLSENSEATVGSPYNEHETFSSNTVGYRGRIGVKMGNERYSVRVEANATAYPDSENVKTTTSLTAGIGLNF